MDDNIKKLGDPYSKTPVTVGGIPNGPTTSYASNAVVSAGSFRTFLITFTPQYPSIAIWNFLITTRIDVNDSAHNYPYGTSITTTLGSKIKVSSWVDYSRSGAISGIRTLVIHVINDDSVDHTVYILAKAFLQTGLSSSNVA